MKKRREKDWFFRNKIEEKYAGSGYNIDKKQREQQKRTKQSRAFDGVAVSLFK